MDTPTTTVLVTLLGVTTTHITTVTTLVVTGPLRMTMNIGTILVKTDGSLSQLMRIITVITATTTAGTTKTRVTNKDVTQATTGATNRWT